MTTDILLDATGALVITDTKKNQRQISRDTLAVKGNVPFAGIEKWQGGIDTIWIILIIAVLIAVGIALGGVVKVIGMLMHRNIKK